MMRRFAIPFLVVASLLGGLPDTGWSQSALVTRGLGLPVEPQDGRSRGLGGVGIGLPEGELSWVSPAGLHGLPAPGIVAAYQFDNFSATGGGADFSGNTARFPFLLAAFPTGSKAVFFAGYGTLFDQTWRLEHPDTLLIGGDSVAVLDEISSTGGVTRIRFGATFSPVENLGIALGTDLYTGSVMRVQGRSFEGQGSPTCCRASWNYSGLGFTTGIHWAPTLATGVAASVTYGGTLDAAPQDSLAEARTYELPLLVRLGLSGRIGQSTLVALSGSWDGWSSLNEALASEGGTRDAWSVNGGLEWDALTILSRPLPIRLGARTSALPFRWGPEAVGDWAGESAFTAGAGVILAGGAVRPDVAIERGSRGGGDSGFDESFWRFSFSIRVLGR